MAHLLPQARATLPLGFTVRAVTHHARPARVHDSFLALDGVCDLRAERAGAIHLLHARAVGARLVLDHGTLHPLHVSHPETIGISTPIGGDRTREKFADANGITHRVPR